MTGHDPDCEAAAARHRGRAHHQDADIGRGGEIDPDPRRLLAPSESRTARIARRLAGGTPPRCGGHDRAWLSLLTGLAAARALGLALKRAHAAASRDEGAARARTARTRRS